MGSYKRPLAALAVALALMTAAACVGVATSSPDGVTTPTAEATATTAATAEATAPDAEAVVAAQEELLARVYETVLPSVVHIRVAQKVGEAEALPPLGLPFDFGPQVPRIPREFYRRGEGSGFVWDAQGYIVTNNHVVAGADSVTVTFADGTELSAQVLGTDPDSDLAVLKVDSPEGDLTPVTLGDSDALRVGQMAIAIGNPFGQEFSLTTGVISALGRTIPSGATPFSIPEAIQTDAAINPGSSGGPLLDRQGRVIGITTQIISRSGASSGVGFAVPINIAKQVVPILIEEGRYDYAWLGILGTTLSRRAAELMDLPPETRGALVLEVSEGSPADKAGLRGSDRTRRVEGQELRLGGDVITAVDGVPVRSMDDLVSYLVRETRPGDTITLTLLRDGREIEVEVTLGSRPRE